MHAWNECSNTDIYMYIFLFYINDFSKISWYEDGQAALGVIEFLFQTRNQCNMVHLYTHYYSTSVLSSWCISPMVAITNSIWRSFDSMGAWLPCISSEHSIIKYLEIIWPLILGKIIGPHESSQGSIAC